MKRLAILTIVLMTMLFGCGKNGSGSGSDKLLQNLQNTTHSNDECPKDLNGSYKGIEGGPADGGDFSVDLFLTDNGDNTSTFSGYLESETLVDGTVKKFQDDDTNVETLSYCKDGVLTIYMQGTGEGVTGNFTMKVRRTGDDLIEIVETWNNTQDGDGTEITILGEKEY